MPQGKLSRGPVALLPHVGFLAVWLKSVHAVFGLQSVRPRPWLERADSTSPHSAPIFSTAWLSQVPSCFLFTCARVFHLAAFWISPWAQYGLRLKPRDWAKSLKKKKKKWRRELKVWVWTLGWGHFGENARCHHDNVDPTGECEEGGEGGISTLRQWSCSPNTHFLAVFISLH